MRRYYRCGILATLLLCSPAWSAEDQDEAASAVGMSDYVTCAVYFRMVAGSMSPRYGRNLGALADIEKEKMGKLIELGRKSAEVEFGTEMATDMFDSEWRAALADMTDQINRNYENVSKLKARYERRCEALIKSVTEE